MVSMGFFNTVYSENYSNVYSYYDYDKYYIDEVHGDTDNRNNMYPYKILQTEVDKNVGKN
jgi:hypothetical protein